MIQRTVGATALLALMLLLTLLLSGCSTSVGPARPTSPPAPGRHAASSSTTTLPAARALPSGTIGTAALVATDGRALGTATIEEFGVHIRVTLGDGAVLAGSSLYVSTFPASSECAADEYALEFGDLATGGTTEDLPRDMMPRTDPTFWRSILLAADKMPPLEGQCARTVLASAPIRWAIAPAGLSAPIVDSGPAPYARGTVVLGATGPTAYTAAAGDTAIAVAARLGISVEDLSWLNPMEFDLRAGMPINLDPATRGMPLN